MKHSTHTVDSSDGLCGEASLFQGHSCAPRVDIEENSGAEST